jgi:hypothetical protein
MVVGFTTTYAISTYQAITTEVQFETRSWQGILNTTLCDKVCQCFVTGQWFLRILSTNKIDRHDEAEILLKMALSTITLADVVPIVEIS